MLKHMGPNLTGSWDEFIADLLYSWDHCYMYTTRLLFEYFKLAGFKDIKIKKFGESDLGFAWDTRNDPDTTYIEARK